jgi:nucleoside-diphosphate-sugar epimerase
MANRKTILVTGAGGFIGGWIVETLHLTDSAHVRAGIRRWSSAARLGRLPVDIAFCDVMNKGQITRALAGVNSVIHCAIGARDVIIEGTRNMLDAALMLGVERFVHLSTAEVYGNVSGKIDETFPYQYMGNQYTDSKIEAEKLCWEFYEQGLPVTVIRPTIVYGPFSKDWTVLLAQRLRSDSWGIFKGHGEGICNLVYINDLVSGVLMAASNESAVGEAFNINGPEMITWNQYFQRFSAALGLPELNTIEPTSSELRSAIMKPVRSSARYILNHFGDLVMGVAARFRVVREAMKRAEKTIRMTPTLAELSLYNRDAFYLASKAQNMLGYSPRFDVDTGLQMSIRWLDHHGLLL